jgi:hypothetical protein
MRLLLNDVRGAFVALERGVKADPWDGPTRDLLARAALLLNDPARAAREGRIAVALRPTEPTTYEAPIQAEVILGHLQEAEALARSGIAQVDRSQSVALHVLLAEVLHAQKRDDDARKEIAVALAIDPKNAGALRVKELIK